MKIVAAYESLIALIHLQHNTVFFLQTKDSETERQGSEWKDEQIILVLNLSVFQKQCDILYIFILQ